jgi:hypothetical protein
MSAPATRPRPRERMIRVAIAVVEIEQVNSRGEVTLTPITAGRFETVTLSAAEEARLDALGALAAPGSTREQVQAELEAARDAYRSARQRLSSGVATSEPRPVF